MTEKEYRERLLELCKTENFSTATDVFYDKLNSLRDDLRKMITENRDDASSLDGTNYYVSESQGNDDADGLSPDTAWKTLKRACEHKYNSGDALLLRRGDKWYENMTAQSGVTYSAYGSGAKPKVYAAHNGKENAWLKTETDGIWLYDCKLADKDIGVIVFNNGEKYAQKKYTLKHITDNLDFVYIFPCDDAADGRLYLRCDEGNPNEVFDNIDISFITKTQASIIKMPGGAHDITIKNLELNYAHDIFFVAGSKNIFVSYCICGWTGGAYISKDNPLRFGGGAGCWHSCNNMVFDHCYIYQQFDSGVTPQYHYREADASIFKDFITTDCLFEKCEYTLEYFQTQTNRDDDLFENMYFGYNLCFNGGCGFGDKTNGSAYLKAWQNHKNHSKNCVIENNVFFEAAEHSISICARNNDRSFSYSQLPLIKQNLFVEPKGKPFATVNEIDYAFDETTYADFEELKFAEDNRFIYSK